jgi:hypothetical protein
VLHLVWPGAPLKVGCAFRSGPVGVFLRKSEMLKVRVRDAPAPCVSSGPSFCPERVSIVSSGSDPALRQRSALDRRIGWAELLRGTPPACVCVMRLNYNRRNAVSCSRILKLKTTGRSAKVTIVESGDGRGVGRLKTKTGRAGVESRRINSGARVKKTPIFSKRTLFENNPLA